ncbi:MAG: hypothetical protein HRF44_10825, partial [Ignavibacterium sp.]
MRFSLPLLCYLFLFIGAHAFGQGRAVVLSTSSDGLIIEYQPSTYSPTQVSINGAPHLYFAESESAFPAGATGLPEESFMVGIPPEGSVSLEVLGVWLERHPSLPPAPVASMELAEEEQRAIVRKFGEESHVRAGAQRPIELAGIHWFRDQRVAVIRVSPLAYEATGELT